MRHSLACNVSLRHFGVWRAGIGVLALLSVASLVAWVVAGRDLWPAAAMVAVGSAMLMVLALAASLARVEAGTLKLEEGCWTFLPAGVAAAEPQAGQLDVALDLGSFMLLSFRPLPVRRTAARRWLPAQRHGHEHDWHALRCAVYSPRRAQGAPPAASAAATEE